MCAAHADVAATATCTRCGRFVCEACTFELEPVLCTTCEATAGDPLHLKHREFSVGGALLDGAKLSLLEAGPMLVIALAFAIPSVVIEALIPAAPGQMFATSWRFSVLYENLVAFIGSQAVLARLIARAEGRVLSVDDALSLSLKTWVRCLGANLRSSIQVLAYSLLFLLPGVRRAVQLAFVDIAVLRSTKEPLQVSTQLVEGRGWPVFGLVCASFATTWVPALLVTAVLGTAGEMLELVRPAALLSGWVLNVSGMVQSSVLLVGYYGLAHSKAEPLPVLPFRAPLG